MVFYNLKNTRLSVPLSINGYITSFWQWSCSAFTLCFSVVFTWNACFCLLLCLRPAELICCKSGSPLVAGVPVRPWKIFVVVGVLPTSLLGFNASPFLAFVVAGWMVLPRSPSARRGVAEGALFCWKDFAAPKLLPAHQVKCNALNNIACVLRVTIQLNLFSVFLKRVLFATYNK